MISQLLLYSLIVAYVCPNLVGINLQDIDFNEYKMNVIGKGNKERTLYLNKACIDAIKEYVEVRPTEGLRNDSKASHKALFLSKRQ